MVFYDTFANSTINGGAATNMIPGGTPTASFTSYEIGSAKNATATTNFAGSFQLATAGTSSGNTEAQALFTKYPVTLVTNGDYVELDYTFTETTNILQGDGGASTGPYCGLYEASQIPPLSGTLLWNGGFSSSSTTADTGGTVNWAGYYAQMWYGGPTAASSSWYIYTRPPQTQANNTDQELAYGSAGGTEHSAATTGTGFPYLIVGSQYTVQFRVTLSAPGTLTVSNALYAGVGISGAPIFTNIANWTGANFMGTNFDGLCIGYRAGDGLSPHIPWTNFINSITVVAGLAAQAGPYFSVTQSGSGCGGATVGLSGSVTTNVYLLFTNGTYNGQSVTGTGAAISFGFETSPATYTVMASNTVTTSVGPMYGSAAVSVGPPSISSQPASITCVSNVAASFSVGASGVSLTYQWYKNGTALTNGGDISGAQTTNLVISPTRASDAATAAQGYYVVIHDVCGDVLTSTPPVSLTLTPPHHLVWVGGNTDDNWEFSELNFTLNGTPTNFNNGDDVTFDDTSANDAVTVTNSVIPTLVTVNSANGYNFSGAGQITGFGQLLDMGSGTLAIYNNNTYTGGTVISNGATLQLGDGNAAANNGSVAGTVTVTSGGTLSYNFAGSGNTTVVLNHALAGSGIVNCMTANGSTIATSTALVSSNFNGTINIQGFTALHASDENAGYALGNGSTINVPDNTQVWLDRSATAYNNTFNIGGTGWLGATPQTGAMRVFDNTITGPIFLQDNARIGGTINGATIQSVISGPYQLEVWGNTNSFVLTMGPTNGSPQAYASTLITSGAISAANSNAISTGPLTLDVAGDMQLNGQNITVADLSSVNQAGQLETTGPTVRNLNSTNAATLTVGADNTSQEFDGTFSDGGAAPFGLTKVGTGTLTLTLLHTNTGAVTVQGGSILLSGISAFANAKLISVASSATFDVSQRSDDTLTLNANQTLAGNGAVNGMVVASAGSTVSAGNTMGTLTASGNITLSGTLSLNLNRTNTPSNCSHLVSSGGSITYGGVLSVTNAGPKLQAGDSFQLFPGATAGFTGFNLQTNDSVNNAIYTWNNTVASNGKITVASVASLINTNPTNIVASVRGGNLTLSWPADHTGWTLQSQTNTLGGGLGTNWVNVAGSTATNQVVIPINPLNGSVFFRLWY